MRRIGTGDAAAFSIFCHRHSGRCYAVALHLVRNAADAEEIVQDALLRVWQSAPRWRETEARVTTWLFRIVVNLSLDQMRRAARLGAPIELAAELIASDPGPESVAGVRELARLVGRAVAQLPPRQRAALSLVICDGLECAEAAQAMNVSVATMESLLVRGRRQVRSTLARQERNRGTDRCPGSKPARRKRWERQLIRVEAVEQHAPGAAPAESEAAPMPLPNISAQEMAHPFV